jgi:hypothetical protein
VTSSNLSTLTSYVSFLSYPARFETQVDLDIFDKILRFYQNKCYFVAYDKWFLEKISRGPLLPIQVLYGEVSNSVAMKKIWLNFISERQSSPGFQSALKSASAVPDVVASYVH